MSLRVTWAVSALLALALTPLGGQAQQVEEEISRKPKSKVQAIYPELARRMNLSGTVKVEVVVLPNGTVKGARVMGGHPPLGPAVGVNAEERHDNRQETLCEFRNHPHHGPGAVPGKPGGRAA